MKFSNPQLVAILAILIAGVVAANVYAPGSVATVTAMATTVFAALFVQRGGPPPSDPPSLTVIDGGGK